MCNFYLSVATRTVVSADPSLRCTLSVAETLDEQAADKQFPMRTKQEEKEQGREVWGK